MGNMVKVVSISVYVETPLTRLMNDVEKPQIHQMNDVETPQIPLNDVESRKYASLCYTPISSARI